ARVQRAIDEGAFDAKEAAQYRAEIQSILEGAITAGIPFKNLEHEQQSHFEAADALARFGQNLYETESWDWKHGAWFALEEQITGRLSAADRQLLERLVHGRPLF